MRANVSNSASANSTSCVPNGSVRNRTAWFTFENVAQHEEIPADGAMSEVLSYKPSLGCLVLPITRFGKYLPPTLYTRNCKEPKIARSGNVGYREWLNAGREKEKEVFEALVKEQSSFTQLNFYFRVVCVVQIISVVKLVKLVKSIHFRHFQHFLIP